MDPHSAMSEAVRCLICLNTFNGQLVATPQHCEHPYCLTCITEWAKTKNSCPVDRLEFNALYQRSCVGGSIQKIVKVELCKGGRLEDDGTDELSVCDKCGRSDQRHLMLLCSACDSRYHIGCISPPLDAVPSEHWFCHECTSENQNASLSIEESDIAEDEIMDLLSEVVPVSSRLRPSTTRQHTLTVGTRTSERIRHQRRRVQTRPPSTVQHVPKYLLKSAARNEDAKMSYFFLKYRGLR
ncbi:PHD and RING finger domain-containing protein 1-like [Trichomycterus rosablanca]|uniref:PHD and RING finger domain-containing protein 1-like n=1 Tax=Trichomycterus rosablanca TaxID=2290929 RepID=UPI002F351B49